MLKNLSKIILNGVVISSFVVAMIVPANVSAVSAVTGLNVYDDTKMDAIASDRVALSRFYSFNGGPSWYTQTNWVSGKPAGSWYGVTVKDDRVVEIHLQYNNLKSTEKTLEVLGELTGLEVIVFHGNNILAIPDSIFKLPKLKELYLGNNKIEEILSSVRESSSLSVLDLTENLIEEIPDELFDAPQLDLLFLNRNNISEIPKSVGSAISLKGLHLDENNISEIPEEVGNISSLVYLSLYKNKIKKIPNSIGKLKNLDLIDLSENLIEEMPDELFDAPKLKVIALSKNKIREIPDSIANAQSLEVLFLDNNRIETISSSISDVKTLQSLSVYKNNLTFSEFYKIKQISGNDWLYDDNFDFEYSEQYPNIGVLANGRGNRGKIRVEDGSKIELKVDLTGEDNEYQWYKNGEKIYGADEQTYDLSIYDSYDYGEYSCVITNKKFEQLTLNTRITVVGK